MRSLGREITGTIEEIKAALEGLPEGSFVIDRTLDIVEKMGSGWYQHRDGELEDDPVDYDLTDYMPLFLLRRGEDDGGGDPGANGNIYVGQNGDHDCNLACFKEHTEDHDCTENCEAFHCEGNCAEEHDCTENCDANHCDGEHFEVYYDSSVEVEEQKLYIDGDPVAHRWEVPKKLWSALTGGN